MLEIRHPVPNRVKGHCTILTFLDNWEKWSQHQLEHIHLTLSNVKRVEKKAKNKPVKFWLGKQQVLCAKDIALYFRFIVNSTSIYPWINLLELKFICSDWFTNYSYWFVWGLRKSTSNIKNNTFTKEDFQMCSNKAIFTLPLPHVLLNSYQFISSSQTPNESSGHMCYWDSWSTSKLHYQVGR